MNQTLDKRKRNPFVLRKNIEISGNILFPLEKDHTFDEFLNSHPLCLFRKKFFFYICLSLN